jgi:hypothetical protein
MGLGEISEEIAEGRHGDAEASAMPQYGSASLLARWVVYGNREHCGSVARRDVTRR